jgi:CRP-like cAMP-binding protein
VISWFQAFAFKFNLYCYSVVKQGEEGERMYVVLDGELDVDLEKIADGSGGGMGNKSKRVALRQLKRGDIFGELCLLTGAPRSASVTAAYQVGLALFRYFAVKTPNDDSQYDSQYSPCNQSDTRE